LFSNRFAFPASCWPANAPGSPAGERMHHYKLNEQAWPKENAPRGHV
jgi:hypothetical protein